MTAVIDDLCACEHQIFIVGDFNLPEINWRLAAASVLQKSKEAIFVEFCVLNSLHPLVDVATRQASDNTPDLILTNAPDNITDLVVAPTPVKTDHLALGCSLRFPSQAAQPHAARLDCMRANMTHIRSHV